MLLYEFAWPSNKNSTIRPACEGEEGGVVSSGGGAGVCSPLLWGVFDGTGEPQQGSYGGVAVLPKHQTCIIKGKK